LRELLADLQALGDRKREVARIELRLLFGVDLRPLSLVPGAKQRSAMLWLHRAILVDAPDRQPNPYDVVMFGLFGSRRRSPALFYLRLGLLAALLLATFVFHFSGTGLGALHAARILLVVLALGGARMAGPRQWGMRQRREPPALGADAIDIGASTQRSDERLQ
jgi:hypothetical protein